MADKRPEFNSTRPQFKQAEPSQVVENKNTAPVEKVEPNKPSMSQNKSVSLSSSSKVSAPSVYPNKNKKIGIISTCLIIFLIIAITLISVLITKSPFQPADISIVLETESSSFSFENIDSDRIEIDEDGNAKITLMPNDSFAGSFSLTSRENPDNPDKKGAVFVRLKLFLLIDGLYYPDFVTAQLKSSSKNSWQTGVDGYYYFNDILNVDQTAIADVVLTLSNKIQQDDLQGRKISINATFEVLQAYAHQSIIETWATAPYSWRTLVSKKYIEQL